MFSPLRRGGLYSSIPALTFRTTREIAMSRLLLSVTNYRDDRSRRIDFVAKEQEKEKNGNI